MSPYIVERFPPLFPRTNICSGYPISSYFPTFLSSDEKIRCFIHSIWRFFGFLPCFVIVYAVLGADIQI